MNAVSYLDFYIEVTGQDAPRYQIGVRSKAGEARTATTFPYTNAELETELQRLENAILYAQVGTRGRLPPQEAAVRDFGARFFEFLLPPGETRSLYYECRRLAEFEGKGVRLNLLIQPPHLAALPWEFLHDPRRRDYIALDPHTPLVRYPEVAQSVAPLPMTPPLRILGLVANPTDLRRLDVEAEQRQMMTALQPLLERGLVEVTWLPGQGWRELQQWMRPGYGPWHIFHFIGHGSFDPHREEGRIFLADEQGQAQAISATQLSRLLAFQRGTLRLAILNACEGARGGKFDALSSTAATLVLDGLPAVLAMQYAITDNAALEFARTFYSALGDNLPVDAAVAEARNAINLQNNASLEWGTPVLTMRSQDGQLFDLAKDEPKQVLPSPPAATPNPLVAPPPSAQVKTSTWSLSRLLTFMLLFMIVVLSLQFGPQISGGLGIKATTSVTPTPLHPDSTTEAPVAVKPTGMNTTLAIAPPSLTVPAATPTKSSTPQPTATMNHQATTTAVEALLATAAAATLTAQPTVTLTSTSSQTPTYTPEPLTATPTDTPVPTAMVTATAEVKFLVTAAAATLTAQPTETFTGIYPYIYRLKIAGCTFAPTDRRQTGFRVQGVAGIVTALHGVADCTTFDAVTDEGKVFSELVITAVDVAHDVVLLSSQELDGLTTDGFVVSPLAMDELLVETVKIVGYPLGLDKQDTELGRVRNIEALDDIIPDAEEPLAFVDRRSPRLDILVLNLQVQLLPGHSGAPLLDQLGQVIGVGNGGLRGGTVNRSWAIPWRDIQWQPANTEAVQQELDRLAHTNPVLALAFSSTYPAIVQPTDQQKTFTGRVVNSQQEPVEGAEVTLSLENGYQVEFTDSAGYYEFAVRNEDIELLREILIEKAGYGRKSQKVFDTLPDKILTDEVASPIPITLEPEQYVLLTFALPLKREPAMSGLLVSEISEGEVVQIIDGPEPEGDNVWWQVRHLRSERIGWIRTSDDKNIFVAPLPQFFVNDYVEMIAQDRRPLYTALNNRKTAAAMVLPGEKLVIRSGPETADGYLWYEVTRESDGVIGWIAFAGYGNVFLELLPAPPTYTRTPMPTFTATPVQVG